MKPRTVQIGHCHTPCGGNTVFSDETNTLIPRKIGQIPGTQGFAISFTAGGSAEASFETGKQPWEGASATLDRKCDASVAYHRSCYIMVKPNTGAKGRARYDYIPTPSGVGTASLYSDVVARCPNYWNNDSCTIDVIIKGFQDSGTTLTYGTTFSVPNDDKWYALLGTSPEFPTGTNEWRFTVQGEEDSKYQIDYNQQYYLKPL